MRFCKLMIGICCVMMLLCACQRTINTPADEIVLYEWRSQLDNGNTVSLRFEDDNAVLTAQNDRFQLTVSGYCAMYDDCFLICDTDTTDNYTFYYQLYGDHIELTCGGGTISLNKVKG